MVKCHNWKWNTHDTQISVWIAVKNCLWNRSLHSNQVSKIFTIIGVLFIVLPIAKGMGVTKPISCVCQFSTYFTISLTLLTCYISCTYFTSVTTCCRTCKMMTVFQRIYRIILENWKGPPMKLMNWVLGTPTPDVMCMSSGDGEMV